MKISRKVKMMSGALLTAVLTLAALTSLPSQVEASACYPHVLTMPVWASGATCAQAEANLQSAGSTQALSTCAKLFSTVCGSVTVVPTNSCYFQGGMYKIDGNASFQCHP